MARRCWQCLSSLARGLVPIRTALRDHPLFRGIQVTLGGVFTEAPL